MALFEKARNTSRRLCPGRDVCAVIRSTANPNVLIKKLEKLPNTDLSKSREVIWGRVTSQMVALLGSVSIVAILD